MHSDQILKLCPELPVDTYNSFENSGRNSRFLMLGQNIKIKVEMIATIIFYQNNCY